MWSRPEAEQIYRRRLVTLKELYRGQLSRVRYQLKEKRRQFLLQWQREGGQKSQGGEGVMEGDQGKDRRREEREGVGWDGGAQICPLQEDPLGLSCLSSTTNCIAYLKGLCLLKGMYTHAYCITAS